MDRTNHRLNVIIERFIEAYDGTAVGQDVRNMFENGTDYDHICDRIDVDYDEYRED